ncbi:MAG: transglutaminase family protein [Chryseolinea sp.]
MKIFNGAGYPFQIAWLDTFYEFRFPLCGKIDVLDMELRAASGDRTLARARRRGCRVGARRGL